MIMTAPIALFEAPEMSEVTRRFVVRDEVKSMTTAIALNGTATAPAVHGIRPRGFDRAVRMTAIAMLKWSQDRESRMFVNHSERSRRLQSTNSELQREAQALRLTQRLGL